MSDDRVVRLDDALEITRQFINEAVACERAKYVDGAWLDRDLVSWSNKRMALYEQRSGATDADDRAKLADTIEKVEAHLDRLHAVKERLEGGRG